MPARRESAVPWAVAGIGIALAILDAIAAGAAHSGRWTAYFAVVAAMSLLLGIAGLAHTGWGRRLRPAGVADSAVSWIAGEGPVRARKAAWLRFRDGEVTFASTRGRGSYNSSAVARCEGGALAAPVSFPLKGQHLLRLLEKLLAEFPHPAPLDRCTCGFYGSLGSLEVPTGGEVLLEVELSGRVLARGDARRGERQRVLAIAIPRRCAAAKAGTDGGAGEEGTLRCGSVAVGLRGAGDRLVPVCESHGGDVVLTPTDIERRGGIPASWMEDGVALHS